MTTKQIKDDIYSWGTDVTLYVCLTRNLRALNPEASDEFKDSLRKCWAMRRKAQRMLRLSENLDWYRAKVYGTVNTEAKVLYRENMAVLQAELEQLESELRPK